MGLFDKKYCNICGEKIGMLGNRKLEDGNCCKDCAKKLSPWFDERRHSTVAQIKEQLAYREDNKQAVAAFNTTGKFGECYRVLCVDEGARKFLIAGENNFREENPDVLDYSQITGVDLDVRDFRRELKRKDADGKEVSYNPPRYEYEYEFYIKIRVRHPWFDEMEFKLNRNKLVLQELGAARRGLFITQASFDPHMSLEYQKYENMAKEIIDTLQGRSGMSCAQASMAGGFDLEAQARMAANAGNSDAAIALYKQSIEQGGGAYICLMQEMHKKLSKSSTPLVDSMDMINWALRAKVSGYEVDEYLRFADDTKQACLGQNITTEPVTAVGDSAATISGMPEGMFAEMSQQSQMPGGSPAAASGAWTCVCGATNTGKFCEYCGSPRP